jgi:hypothetical protein
VIETGDPTTYRIYHNQDLIVRTVTPGRYTYRARVTVITPGVGIKEYEAEHASRKQAIRQATAKWALGARTTKEFDFDTRESRNPSRISDSVLQDVG